MFGFALFGIWRQMQKPLKAIVHRRAGVLMGLLKSRLSNMTGALMRAIESDLARTGINEHWVTGEVREVGASRFGSPVLSVKVFPFDAIIGSTTLAEAVVGALRDDVALDYARMKVELKDEEWAQLLSTYGSEVVRLMMGKAVDELIRTQTSLYANMVIIDVADSVPMRVNGSPSLQKVIVLFSGGYAGSDRAQKRDRARRIRNAAKVWHQRNDGHHEWKVHEYDGFKAR